jgi:hypothetical protein
LWFFGHDEKKIRINCILRLSVQKSQTPSDDEIIEASGFSVIYNNGVDDKLNLLFGHSNGYKGMIKDFAVEYNILII